MGLAFTEERNQERKKALKDFSNRAGAEKILRLIGLSLSLPSFMSRSGRSRMEKIRTTTAAAARMTIK